MLHWVIPLHLFTSSMLVVLNDGYQETSIIFWLVFDIYDNFRFLLQARDAFFRAEPWVVPWTAKTVIQV